MLNSEQEKILQEEITIVQKEAIVKVAPNQIQFICVYNSKEGRGVSAHYKPETVKQIPSIWTFLDGGIVHGPRSNRKGLLHAQNRSERCISNSPNHHKGSKVFKVSMETGAVSVSDTFIRVLMKSAISFHQQMKSMTKWLEKAQEYFYEGRD